MPIKNKKTLKYQSYKEIDDAIAEMAAIVLTADKKEIKMNEEILAAKKKYESDIQALRDKAEQNEKDIKEFCLFNKEAFKEKRSMSLTFGKIGFRSCNAALKTISKAWTWDRAKEKFEKLFGTRYVNTKTTLNKEKILQDANNSVLTEAQLLAAGCKTVKGESFFIEIDYSKVKLESAQ